MLSNLVELQKNIILEKNLKFEKVNFDEQNSVVVKTDKKRLEQIFSNVLLLICCLASVGTVIHFKFDLNEDQD